MLLQEGEDGVGYAAIVGEAGHFALSAEFAVADGREPAVEGAVGNRHDLQRIEEDGAVALGVVIGIEFPESFVEHAGELEHVF